MATPDELIRENERLAVRCDRLAQIATASVALAELVDQSHGLALGILDAKHRLDYNEPAESEIGALAQRLRTMEIHINDALGLLRTINSDVDERHHRLTEQLEDLSSELREARS